MQLGEKLAHQLSGGDTVLLFGDLGTGKTHFSKGVAKGLGIQEIIKSPTFTYVKNYSTKSKKELFHYDLYRLEKGDDLGSIGLEESIENQNAINVIEWADRMEFFPNKYIAVTIEIEGGNRKINIEFIDPEIVPKEKIEEFYKEWTTPIHVRKHCKAVTYIANKVGNEFIKKGEIINANLIYSAGMLHDVARLCDFGGLNRNGFQEEVTDEKWTTWQKQQVDFKGKQHEQITNELLIKKGYKKTAEIIRLHRTLSIIEEPEAFNTLEKKILFYADKRAKHDEVVDLEERFRDGRERNGQQNSEKENLMFDIIKQQTIKLEKELFEKLDIGPEDI